MWERRDIYRILVGNLREKDHLEEAGLEWEDNIKMDLEEVGCGAMV
jgi:hypothetical protein